MDFNITTDKDVDKLSSQLGYWLWNIAVSLAPYDTGNLRRAITLNSNTDTRKKFVYNAFNAVYLHYLEEGMGSVKKHKGFISERTVGAFVQEIITYLITGKQPIISSPPVATLGISRHGAMFHENKILKSLNLSTMNITADDRRKLSQLKFRNITPANTMSAGGKQTDIRRLYKNNLNKDISHFWIDEKDYDSSYEKAFTLEMLERK